MSYCGTHGWYSDSEDGCSECRFAEEENRRRLDDLVDRIEKPNDFGDFVCPHCLYKSLRRNAKRCPTCHADVGANFWEQVAQTESRVAERERAAAEQARLRKIQEAEEWERGAPARQAAAEEAAAIQRRKDANTSAKSLFKLYVGLLGPTLLMAITDSFTSGDPQKYAPGLGCLAFIPGLNWIACAMVLLIGGKFSVKATLVFAASIFLVWIMLRNVYTNEKVWLARIVLVLGTLLFAWISFDVVQI